MAEILATWLNEEVGLSQVSFFSILVFSRDQKWLEALKLVDDLILLCLL